jgi:hypothetical protein
MSGIVIRVVDSSINNEPNIEESTNKKPDIYLKYLIRTTFISCLRSKNKYINYLTFILLNLALIGSIFSMYWYPTYYLSQPIIWTLDLVIIFITFNYLCYLFQKDFEKDLIDNYAITSWKNNINLFFYSAFMIYYFYFGCIQFYIHSEPNILIQLGNLYMSFAWYLFFSTISLLYYFICYRLLQRSEQMRDWLKRLKKKYRNQSLELEHEDCDFYNEYNLNYSIIKNFAKYWNFLIFIGFLLLIAHIPIDLISIIYEKIYYDIPGFIIKTGAFCWYLYCICQLNDYEDKIIPYLYKHRIYNDNQIEYISKYIKYRPLGLNFYGIKISGSYITKYLIIGINLLIPTLYALFSKNVKLFS